jgi:hypothetical protein
MARMLMCASRTVRVTIASSVRSPNIAALAIALGWDGNSQIELVINSGVDVATLSISGIGANLLHIIVNGRIGGVFNGGTGLYTRTPIRITNNGTMFGGGGAGGTGGGAWVQYHGSSGGASGGGGGQGQGFSASGTVTMLGSTGGGRGSDYQYQGAIFPGDTAPSASGGWGGSGGAIGQPGFSGGWGGVGGSATASETTPPGDGQPAGYYVDGNAYITWLATGARLGRVI